MKRAELSALAAIPPLIHRLGTLRERAERERWPGWHGEDSLSVERVMLDLAEIRAELDHDLQEAFELGLVHGRQEELLARVQREVVEETVRLGQRAWGHKAGKQPRSGSRP